MSHPEPSTSQAHHVPPPFKSQMPKTKYSKSSNAQLVTARDQLIDIMAIQVNHQANVTRHMQAFQEEISRLWGHMIEMHDKPRRLQDIIMDFVMMVSSFIQLLLEHIKDRLGLKHMVGAHKDDVQRVALLILQDAEELLDMIKDFRMAEDNDLGYKLDMYLDNKASSDMKQFAIPPMSEKKKGKQPAKPPRAKSAKKTGSSTSSTSMLEKEKWKQPTMPPLPSNVFLECKSSKMPTNQQELKEYLRQKLEPLPAEERVMAILELPLKAIDILLSKDDNASADGGSKPENKNTQTQVYVFLSKWIALTQT